MSYAARLVLPGIFLLSCSVACGQVAGTVSTVGPVSAMPQPGVVCSVTIPPMRGWLVKGKVAPYSATQESSNTQTLADGTVISPKRPSEKVWRDSEGRVRYEQLICMTRDVPEPETYVRILDPVAGYVYILDPATHTAHRFEMKVREHGTSPPKPAEVAAEFGFSSTPVSTSPKLVSESLGTQMIEGVPVEGTRTTETVPTGQFDNDRPFNIVREIWTSPLLHVTVYSKTLDPRYGESVTRLTSVELAEPDPALFRPPADYTLVDDGQPVKLTVERPSPPTAQK